MITKFHIHENSVEPEIGDYALLKGTTKIGVINDIVKNLAVGFTFVIEFDTPLVDVDGLELEFVTKADGKYEYVALRNEFVFSKSKEELELIINSIKYNL